MAFRPVRLPRRGRERDIAFASMVVTPFPIRPRARNRTARTERPRSSIRRPTSGLTTVGAAIQADQLVIYELHVGTFSPAGTFDGVIEHLPYLRELGVPRSS